MESWSELSNELSRAEDFFVATTKRAFNLSNLFSDVKSFEEDLKYYWGQEELDYFYELSDPAQHVAPLWVVYHELQASYSIFVTLLTKRGFKIYGDFPTLNDALAKPVVLYKTEIVEEGEEKGVKLVLSFGKEEKIIGFHVKASLFTLEQGLSYAEEQEKLREILKVEKVKELEKEKVEKIYEALLEAKGEKLEKEKEETKTVKVIRDLDLTLSRLEEKTGLTSEEILKGIGKLIREEILTPYYGYFELVIKSFDPQFPLRP